jgi:hypothetical protein
MLIEVGYCRQRKMVEGENENKTGTISDEEPESCTQMWLVSSYCMNGV